MNGPISPMMLVSDAAERLTVDGCGVGAALGVSRTGSADGNTVLFLQ